MSSDFPHYSFRMPNIGFQNLPLNIYIVVFGTAIFVFILSLLFCCYLIRLRHQAHKELYAYKQLRLRLKQLNSPSLFQICAVCLEEFKQKDELGICPCKHAFHRNKYDTWKLNTTVDTPKLHHEKIRSHPQYHLPPCQPTLSPVWVLQASRCSVFLQLQLLLWSSSGYQSCRLFTCIRSDQCPQLL
uniref:Ring finger protein 24 n=1 Tax=Acanthochromis polyacanthus TaxID=80966 RepID=A0A3Q1ER17_9TELE